MISLALKNEECNCSQGVGMKLVTLTVEEGRGLPRERGLSHGRQDLRQGLV